jgi:hypothetical protein
MNPVPPRAVSGITLVRGLQAYLQQCTGGGPEGDTHFLVLFTERQGLLTSAVLERLAQRLARFHREALQAQAGVDAPYGTPAAPWLRS